MEITSNSWRAYIQKLNQINSKAGELMEAWVEKHGLEDRNALIEYAYSLSSHYGEASAAITCQMYDEITMAEGLTLPDAAPSSTASMDEVAKAVNGSLKQSPTGQLLNSVLYRLSKQASADTMLHNAARDGAEFAWVPIGDTCAFCIALASRGWQRATASLLNTHAEHIHAHCDCTFAVRHDKNSKVGGYDPDEYRRMYDNADGKNAREKINSIRRMKYQENKDRTGRKPLKELSQHKKGDKVIITEQAINKVKAIGPSDYSEEQLEIIREMNRKLLKISRDNNNSNEVAMAFVNGKISKPVLGGQNEVNIYEDPEMYHILKGRDAKLHSVILSHNHPGLSYFSVGDLQLFTECPSIKAIETITNSGTTWYISKKDNYDDLAAFNLLKKSIKDNKGNDDKIVADYLKSVYNMIERNR